MARRRSPRSKRKPSRRRRRALALRRWALLGLLALAGAGALYTAWLDYDIRTRFDGRRWQLPARLYARALDLYPGQRLSREQLLGELELLGYRSRPEAATPGTYRAHAHAVELHSRGFDFWDGREPARAMLVRFRDGRISALSGPQGGALPLGRLEPAIIGRIYPRHHEDRVLVRLQNVPQTLVQALIAMEDRQFREHAGVDPKAIARALWANVRAGRAVQGGSTLTQQLVKNFFLSQERTLVRKANEALMALLLERRYDKDAILEAYLNEVFLGQQGQRAIHGFGLAAEFYFGRPLQELELAEQALLVALVRGASYYNPRAHPERALERRNLVLGVMATQGLIDAPTARAARARPLGVSPEPPPAASPFPAFLDLARRQLHRDYREEDLRSEGLQIFTTLDPLVQSAAEQALSRRIARLERDHHLPGGALEGAVLVTDVEAGEVLAVVGGRRARRSGFNRALDAVRPVGSLVKPAVYLSALGRDGGYSVASILADEPIRIQGPQGRIWAPKNYDEQAHGDVLLRDALKYSYNLATVHLGMGVGLPKVVRTLHRLGIERPVDPYPSLLLGAVELSPLDVARMYRTVAGLGFSAPLRAIREVLGPDGQPLQRYRLSVTQAVDPAAAYLLGWLLQEAAREGTGRSAYARIPGRPRLAGKTGTTDDLRDSWYAGFGGDRLAVVWLGRDDNRPAGLSGAQGALQVWGDLMSRLRPASWSPPVPEGVQWHWIDSAQRPGHRCALSGRRAHALPGRRRPGACAVRGLKPGGALLVLNPLHRRAAGRAGLLCAAALLAAGCAAPRGPSSVSVPVEERGVPVRSGKASAMPAPRSAPPVPGPEQQAQEGAGAPATPRTPAAPAAVSPAVVALLNQANRQSSGGELEQATASLERALRIEPSNAWLWHRLAMIRLFQHQDREAVELAMKSNVLAVGNRRLQADNWRIVAQARERLGQPEQAQKAADQVRRLSQGSGF